MDWRRGIYVVILAGFLQDPIRKMVEGQPVVFTLIAPALFGVCFVSALLAGERIGFKELNRFNPVLFVPASLFIGWVSISVVMAYLNTQSIQLAGIGAMAYLAPLPGLMLGYRFARAPVDVTRMLWFYIAVATLFSLSLYLEAAGLNWTTLGSVGEGFVFYPESGGVTVLRSGFFRSPEVAGWHAAAAICFVGILGIAKKPDWKFVIIAVVVSVLVLPALVLTGRRKFLVEIVMFMGFAFALVTYFRSGSRRIAVVFTVAAIVAAGFYFYITSSELPGEWSIYLDRSATTTADTKDRFLLMTVGMFRYVIARNGFFGSGAGTGSQGAQHFGGGEVLVGSSAEGGLGKVLGELGIPGLILLTWIFFAAARYILVAAKWVRDDENVAALSYGILAFLTANAVVFTTAHQIFGDINILLLMGLLLGILMRAPYLMKGPRILSPRPLKRRVGRRFAERITP
jgi:hypothetical protein